MSLGLGLSSFLAADTAQQSLSDLDALTARWIALRGTLAEEATLWEQRKAQWEEELKLLREESAALQREIDSNQSFMSETELRRAEAAAGLEQNEAELEALAEQVAAARKRIQEVQPLIPESLRVHLPLSWEEVEASSLDAAGRSRSAQNVLAYLSGLETIQNRLHVTRETLEFSGVRREVDVLYVGLAAAWAVSPDTTWSAMGKPTAQGWQWSEGGVDPQRVRKAIRVYQQDESASLVTLPLQVQELQP